MNQWHPSPDGPIRRRITELPAEYACKIGRIVAGWSAIENCLSDAIYRVLGLDPEVARIVVRDPGAPELLAMLRQLVELHGGLEAEETDWDTLATNLDKVQTQRNLVAHSAWLEVEGLEGLFIVRTQGKWNPAPGVQGISRRRSPELVRWDPDDFAEPLRLITELVEGLDILARSITQPASGVSADPVP